MKIGYKLRRLRLQRGLTVDQLAKRCDTSEGYISMVEKDLTSPSLDTLQKILECLGRDLTYLIEEQSDKIVYSENDTFVKSDGNIITHWLAPNCVMEPMLVEMQTEAATEWYPKGEKLGYVLSGTVQIEFADRVEKARKGECFYFNVKEPFRFVNPNKATARYLLARRKK